jgi:sulfide dehydrogenase cytochrome subunit
MIGKTALTLIAGASLLLGGTVVAEPNGAELAEKCERCHGKNGNSDKEQVPSIAGFSAAYFTDTMKAYKKGDRQADKFKTEGHDETDMKAIAESFDEKELTALGKYFAAQTFVPRQQDFDSKLARKGKKVHKKRCRKCHTSKGSDPDDDAGILAGQWMPYLESQLEQFFNGTRTTQPKKMKKQMDKLNKDEDVPALLHFFASQQ